MYKVTVQTVTQAQAVKLQNTIPNRIIKSIRRCSEIVKTIELYYQPYWLVSLTIKATKKSKETIEDVSIVINDSSKLSSLLGVSLDLQDVRVLKGEPRPPKLKSEDVKEKAKDLVRQTITYPKSHFYKKKLEFLKINPVLFYRPFWDVELAIGGGKLVSADSFKIVSG